MWKWWKHITVTPFECGIVLVYKGVHVWVYLTSNPWNTFTILLHNMLKYNSSKQEVRKEITLCYFIKWEIEIYL
jgi:hypothetical protein